MSGELRAPSLFALLVGIDRYETGVPVLGGCVADVHAVRDLLLRRVPDADILVLVDEQATRSAVTAAISDHLGQAGPGSSALFWFAGHGSQQRTTAPPGVEADGLDETLVLFDSREEGGRDLTDKELGALIAPPANAGAHVVVGLDCCHSGSGTREDPAPGTRARRAPTDLRVHTGPVTPGATPGAPTPDRSGWQLPARHVLIAACRSDETAKETVVAGATRGVLTVAFEQALAGAGPADTYRDLLRRIRASSTVAAVSRQTPQVEVVDSADAGARIFTGAIADRPAHYLASWDAAAGEWSMDAGAVHGLPEVAADPLLVALRPLDDDSAPAVTATVTRVLPHRSVLTAAPAGPALDRAQSYRATVTAWPLPRVGVVLDDNAAGDSGLVTALEASALLVRADTGDLEVHGSRDGHRIVDRTRGPGVVHQVSTGASADTVVRSLEQVVRWRQLIALENPPTGIAADAVAVTFDVAPAAVRSGDTITFPYTDGANGPAPQEFRLNLRNTTRQDLYCAVLVLGEDYAVSALPFSDGGWLPPAGPDGAGGAVTVRLRAEVPRALADRGVVRRTDVFKVVICTDEFDPSPLVQGGLAAPFASGSGTRGTTDRTVLDRLLRRIQQREISVVHDSDLTLVDWSTRTFRIVAERPGVGSDLSAGPVELPGGLRVTAPPGLTGTVAVTGAAIVARDAVVALVPPLLVDAPELWDAFPLNATRGIESVADVLELRDVADPAVVTRDTPLALQLPTALAPDESLVVIGFDGRNYTVVGAAVRSAGEPTDQVRITHLPPAVEGRSLGGAIRLLFRRFRHRLAGNDTPVTRLAVATIDASDGSVRYDDDRDDLRTAVAGATRILLLVHGIIGDTRGMVLGSAVTDGEHVPVQDLYDLVLTFDYENLATPVGQTAAALAGLLRDAGLDGSQQLDIVAHSMGGLVSRWMIELTPDAPPVHRLITAGTPNGGSPWSRLEDWAVTVLSFGLNRLAEIFWPAHVLAGLVRLVEVVDRTLDDMAPRSAMLAQLHGAPDPGVPYVALHGDRELIQRPAPGNRVAALLQRLTGAAVDSGVGWAFQDQINDLAVSQASAFRLPPAREPAPVPVSGVGCAHMPYFASPAGRAALRQAITAP